MKIAVVGTGYVGLVCGAGFAEMGNQVVCVDTDSAKIKALREGIIPIYEPGLEEIVHRNVEAGVLSFTTELKDALEIANICLIAVGTPLGEDGSADLSHVLSVAENIGRHMTRHTYIITKSTVPVGTADKVKAVIRDTLLKLGKNVTFNVISNPEFLKEGAALDDFLKPDRIIVGVDNNDALEIMRELYGPFTKNRDNLMTMDIRSSEMTKYAANAMLATKISFMNEIANICERVGADVNMVRIGIGSDSRIGYAFIYPGCGYGGSCFPKDVQALVKTAGECGYEPSLLRSVEDVNIKQKRVLVDKVVSRFGARLQGRCFAVWGLSFKPGTDDMREAPSIPIITGLIEHGARVKAYDPKAVDEARSCYLKGLPSLEYTDSKYDAVKEADALLLVTEWKEFRSPDFDELKKLMRSPIIFDGRNQYNRNKMLKDGFEYYQIGV